MKPVLLSQHAVYTVCFWLLTKVGYFKQSVCIPPKMSLNILGGKFWGWNFLKNFGSEPRQLLNNFLNFSHFEPRLLIKCLLTKKNQCSPSLDRKSEQMSPYFCQIPAFEAWFLDLCSGNRVSSANFQILRTKLTNKITNTISTVVDIIF